MPRTPLIFVAVLGTAAPALGEADAGIFERERLLGDWWCARTSLENAGLSINGAYVAEFSSVLDGGINRRGSFRNVLTVDATLDLGVAFGLEGGTLFVQYLSVNGESGGTLDSGDIQVYSNIESDIHLDTIYEAWYEQVLFDDRVRFKIGKLDANSEFNVVDAAGDFAHSSAGFSPTIIGFPSYPDPATSVNVFGTLVDEEAWSLTLGYGFYDGALALDGVRTGGRGPASFFTDDASDDYFHVWQGELAWDERAGESRFFTGGRLALGGWHHTGDFARFDGGTNEGTTGFFATAELRVFDPDPSDDESERGVYVFGQYAWADEEVGEIAQHLGAGVVWRGPFDARPDDSAGLYLSHVDLSDEPGAGFEDDELAIDVYYRARVTPAVFVQPELQYIVNPSGDPEIDDALVAGLRVGVAF